MMKMAAGLALAMVVMTGCESSTEPDRDDVVGTYIADADMNGSQFEFRAAGDTTDLLDQGSTVTLTLNENGTVTGDIFVPIDPDIEESGLDTNLTGTWTYDDDDGVVAIETTQDTFLESFEFEADDDYITATTSTLRLRLIRD